VRNAASPDIFTEDFSAAVDHLGLLPDVDRERIGAMAICGLSGMALTAATGDSRIKAVATASMYDMSRSMSRGHKDGYTLEQRRKVIDHLSQQRWIDAEKGVFSPGLHEVPFDGRGQRVQGQRVLPERLPADPDPVLAAFFDYYRTPCGFHPRAINPPTRPQVRLAVNSRRRTAASAKGRLLAGEGGEEETAGDVLGRFGTS